MLMLARPPLAALLLTTSCAAQLAAQAASPAPSRAPQRVEREGVTVELRVEAVDGAALLREGRDADLRLSLRDVAGTPVTGLRPAVWIDAQGDGRGPHAGGCSDKIKAFLQGSLSARPSVDLNSFYVVTLNDEPNLSVIDPLVEYGGSRLLALASLDAPGEDWVASADGRRIYVSLPGLSRVAVVDTSTWSTAARIEVGPRPTQVLMQADQRALWVAQDPLAPALAEGGVTVVDLAAGRAVKRLTTGAGPHVLSFGRDERVVYVLNRGAGTLQVVDTDTYAILREHKLGPAPSSVAYSRLSGAAYVTDESDGSLTVLDGESHELRARLQSKPGLTLVRVSPDGRWVFLLNPREGLVEVVDSSSDRVAHRLSLPDGPDDVVFSRSSAYFHQSRSETVGLVALQALSAPDTPGVFTFPGGEAAPEKAGPRARASALAPSPEGDAVLVANPVDQVLYYYKEGMAVPMGHYQNYRRSPRAVMVVDRSLREREGGEYVGRLTLPAAGRYDVAVLVDAPRVAHCFDLQIEPPSETRASAPRARLELLEGESELVAGRPARVRVRLLDPLASAPRTGLQDALLLVVQPPGVWQQRVPLRAVPGRDGSYDAEISFPEAALYYFFVGIPSLGLAVNDVPFVTATVAPAAAGKDAR